MPSATDHCCTCFYYDRDKCNEDKDHWCNLLDTFVGMFKICPGWKQREYSAEEIAERERLLALYNVNSVNNSNVKNTSKISKQKTKLVERELERDDTVKLFKHQVEAREKFKCLDEIALFFEMGCGKTLTSMMIMCDKFKEKKIDSLLIVAPNDVHKQWFDDLCDDDSVLSKAIAQEEVECDGQIIGGRGGQKELYEFDYDNNKLHIVCVNIDTFSTPSKWKPIVEWANEHNTAIILDEATVIKNHKSMRSQRMLYEFNDVKRRGRNTILSSTKKHPVRVVLTGTPVTNGPIDLWAIMEFVRPNYFKRNYYSFTNYYGMHTQLTAQDRVVNVLLNEKTWRGIKNCYDFAEAHSIFGCSEDTYLTVMHQDHYSGPYKHADELKMLLEPNAVFAKLVDCADMPAVNYIVRNISMSNAQKAAYSSMKKDMLAEFNEHVSYAKNKLVMSIRLQQISSGFITGHREVMNEDEPMWSDDAYDVMPDEVVWLDDTNPKLEALLRDIDELDKPLLIFTRFSAEAAKIYDKIKDNYSTMLFTGWKTTGTIEDFKVGKYDIIVANVSKIARGFNLQCAHTTLYYSNTFSMEIRQQSEFRTFRMGQQHPCTYIDYISCDIDKTIIEALRLKKSLLDYIRDRDAGSIF
ncbi:DEAD/DEAH box helicase [bacterium]|nr:DEAD/DEAH box helicase [bacterium]